MTLSDLREALSARRLVALTLSVSATGEWTAAARGEGSGWTCGAPQATPDAAVENMLVETWAISDLPPIRYFLSSGERPLLVTYNGGEPLKSEGPWTEVDAAAYRAAKESMMPRQSALAGLDSLFD